MIYGLAKVRSHYRRRYEEARQGRMVSPYVVVIKGHRTTAWEEEERELSMFNSPNPARNQRTRKSRYCGLDEPASQGSN